MALYGRVDRDVDRGIVRQGGSWHCTVGWIVTWIVALYGRVDRGIVRQGGSWHCTVGWIVALYGRVDRGIVS